MYWGLVRAHAVSCQVRNFRQLRASPFTLTHTHTHSRGVCQSRGSETYWVCRLTKGLGVLVVLSLMKQSAHGSIQALTAAGHGGRFNLYKSVKSGFFFTRSPPLCSGFLKYLWKRVFCLEEETMCLFTPQYDSCIFMPRCISSVL